MKPTYRSSFPLAAMIASLTLTACGGGSSGSSGSPDQPEIPAPEGNKAPSFGAIEPIVLDDIEKLSFALQASDADQDALVFSLISKPESLDIQVTTTGQVTVTPTKGKGLTGSVVVSVSDGEDSTNQEIPVAVLKTELFAGIDDDGKELWITNGTEEGTRKVKDISPGSGSSMPDQFTQLDDLTYFTASHPDYGREIWQTDGTEAGTKLVVDFDNRIINDTNQSAQIREMVAWQDNIYFSALVPGNTTSAIYRLPEGDETTAQGVTGYSPLKLTPVGDKLYYTDYNSQTGYELYVYTKENGSDRLTDIYADGGHGIDPNHTQLLAVGDALYFIGNDPSTTGVHGYWRTTGTADSVSKVSFDSERVYRYLKPAVVGDRLFYTRQQISGTTFVMQVGINDENPHSDGVFSLNSVKPDYDINLLGQYAIGNHFVVIAHYTPSGEGASEDWIFVSDKTDEGNYTMKGSKLPVSFRTINQVAQAGNNIYIAAQDYSNNDYKMWSLSISENGDVGSLKEIANPLLANSEKRDVRFDFKDDRQTYQAGAEGGMLFGGYDETNGWELWLTKDSESSASLVKDIASGTGNGLGTLVDHGPGPCERCEF